MKTGTHDDVERILMDGRERKSELLLKCYS